jgi:outer membrane protein OmpA-like peptidoglycan-associated protein
MYLWSLLFALFLASVAQAAGIQGAAERRAFTPGDQVLFSTDLSRCPVGEFAKGIQPGQGAYECARFRDRIWLRPQSMGTVLWVEIPRPLKEDFSLEFPVWLAEDGCAFVEFRLHGVSKRKNWRNSSMAYAYNALAGGHLACSRENSGFGAMNHPGRLRFGLGARLDKGRIHRIAVQVRRAQIRFYVNGRMVGHQPFQPDVPVGSLSFYFARQYGSRTAYADASALVGDIRLAVYSRGEAVPQAEKDLIRDLGAVQTPAGLKVTLSEAILFDFGKWTLKPEAAETLDRLARLARLRKGAIRVEGHTDNVGTPAFNRVLSELRAHVVALALARRGVDASRLQPRGWGESRPIAPNDSAANRARNRRVEVIFVRDKR